MSMCMCGVCMNVCVCVCVCVCLCVCVLLCSFPCVISIDLLFVPTDNRHYAGTLGFSLSSHISSGKLSLVCSELVKIHSSYCFLCMSP